MNSGLANENEEVIGLFELGRNGRRKNGLLLDYRLMHTPGYDR
jgi:hypothetical protein